MLCSKCLETKDVIEFDATNLARRNNGIWGACKGCVKAYNAQYTIDHGEERCEHERQKRLAMTKEERIEKNKKMVEYNRNNREKQRARSLRYYYKNPAICLERNLAWQAANPDKVRENGVQSEARKRAIAKEDAQNDMTAQQFREICAAQGFRCAYCGKKSKRLEMEHIIPRSKGGSNTYTNIVGACRSCNSKKHTGPVLSPVQPLLLTIAPSKPHKTRS